MKPDECKHVFASLGFQVISQTDSKVEAIAAIHCTKCGLFRTKILTFLRELTQNETKA